MFVLSIKWLNELFTKIYIIFGLYILSIILGPLLRIINVDRLLKSLTHINPHIFQANYHRTILILKLKIIL